MKCALCGYEFDEHSLICHVRCPMAAGCAIVCCPNCGYQVVDAGKSLAANWVKRMQAALAGRNRSQEPKS